MNPSNTMTLTHLCGEFAQVCANSSKTIVQNRNNDHWAVSTNQSRGDLRLRQRCSTGRDIYNSDYYENLDHYYEKVKKLDGPSHFSLRGGGSLDCKL